MTTKIKGICKPLKYISQIFVVKDREMEIGYPTDVKRVASNVCLVMLQMNEFKSSSDYSGMSLGGSIGEETDPSFVPVSSWSSQAFCNFLASIYKMKSPSDRKPPLAESPTRRRPRRILRSSACSIQTPSASMAKAQTTNRLRDMGGSDIPPKYQSISCELRALAKMVENEFGKNELGSADFPEIFSANSSPLFERGRFYDAYSARRNERLKRKKCAATGEDSRRSICNLGVTVESGKRRDLKKYESLRKSVPANFSIARTENHRYSLRSNTKVQENKNPSTPMNSVRSLIDGDRKVGARRVRKI